MRTELERKMRAIDLQMETDPRVILSDLATMLEHDRRCERPETIVTLSRFAALLPVRLSPTGSVLDLDHQDKSGPAFRQVRVSVDAERRGNGGDTCA